MVWCSYCAKDQQAERDDINGFTCCTGCGRVLDDNVYGSDPTFTKTAGGQSQVEGNFVKDGQNSFGRLGAGAGRILGYQSDSHEKTLAKGKHEIVEILERLSIRPRDDIATQAHRFYTIALERNFTRGRRTQQVAASCIYIVCRQNNKPYMLIDFSDCLQTNVYAPNFGKNLSQEVHEKLLPYLYVLGAVFLQLCNLLRLEEQPFMQKPVDPSLFIHRFADRLRFGKKMHAVSNTALRLVASMKRDWMQTGRRPSGICGAALFISAAIHGFERSKGDVVSVVHICEGTLKRRLVEFECTESGSLTAEEFELKGQEIEAQIKAGVHLASSMGSLSITEIMCEHKDTGTAHFSHGLCRPCYEEFVRVSGGMRGGSAPPAFQKAELLRMQAVRDQLKSQGLNSDDEDEEGVPIPSLKGSKKGVLLTGKAGDLVAVSKGDSNYLPPTGHCRGTGRGRGRGRGRMRAQLSTEEASVEELYDSGRGGRVRGIREDVQGTITGALTQGTKAGPGIAVIDKVIEHRKTAREIDYLRVRNKGRRGQIQRALNGNDVNRNGLKENEAGLIVTSASEAKSAEMSRRLLAEEAQDAPDDNDVLWPAKGLVDRKASVKSSSENEIAMTSHVLEKNGKTKLEKTSFNVYEPQVCHPSVTALGSQSRIVVKSFGTTAGKENMETQENSFGEPPELVDSENAPTEPLSPAILDSPAGIAKFNDSMVLESSDVHRTDCLLEDESLSDIDDNELIGYMNNDEEVRLKTIIWTEMNKEYIQEQEAKQAALAAMEQARAAAIAAAASNSASAAELAAAAAAAVAQMKKDRKQKRADDAKRPPAQSAAEATRQMLESKKLSTKVDYTVLAKLFDTDESRSCGTTDTMKQDEDVDSEAPNMSSKRTRFGSQTDVSQGDSVITQISARRPLMREVDSKEGSVGVVDMNEDEVDVDVEEDAMAEDGEVDTGGVPYDYDEPDDYYDEY